MKPRNSGTPNRDRINAAQAWKPPTTAQIQANRPQINANSIGVSTVATKRALADNGATKKAPK